MRWHRRQVLGGYLSLVTADTHLDALGRAGSLPVSESMPKKTAPQVIIRPSLPRSPYMRDDDPLVLDGTYA